ncbi:hypothetical protein HRbin08_02122 [bacterium HR08]|nr:hypothetical protein HRbin08_02122 [bacterium HR08]
MVPREIIYESEGERVRALLFLPECPRRGGVILAPGRTREITALQWLAQAVTEAGFVTLGITYRDREVQYHRTDVADVREAITYFQKELGEERIAAIGHSRGGAAVLNAAAEDHRIRSVIAMSAISDRARYVQGLRLYAPTRYELFVKAHGGTPEEIPEYYRETSALEKAGRIRIPVLLIHGDLDLLVPFEHSVWMHQALQQAGNPHARLEILSGVGHFFESTFTGYVFDKVCSLCVRWLGETLS